MAVIGRRGATLLGMASALVVGAGACGERQEGPIGTTGSASHMGDPGEPIDWQIPSEQSGHSPYHPDTTPLDVTIYEGIVTCADIGAGNASTRVEDPSGYPNFEGSGKLFTLEGGHRTRFWGCCAAPHEPGYFWVSSIPIDALIVHGVPNHPEAPPGPKSSVQEFEPPTLAGFGHYPTYVDAWSNRYGIDSNEYDVRSLELCYTLPDAPGGQDAGVEPSPTDGGARPPGKTF